MVILKQQRYMDELGLTLTSIMTILFMWRVIINYSEVIFGATVIKLFL